MFQPEIPPPLRALSLFHCWMPFLLLWLVYRLSYDARGAPDRRRRRRDPARLRQPGAGAARAAHFTIQIVFQN
jgi:hypothetical protein